MDEPLILNRYRLLERLAVGGSAEVWRAHDEQLDRPVAVKRLHPHLFADAGSRARLAAEARSAARLSHPVIVDMYDVDATGDAPALIMELVDGQSLAARIERDGPLDERAAAAVAADLGDALYHAHGQGVIHRDVKPGNVLISTDGRTRLVDFGIAHSLAEATERLTATGTVIGTLRSMAPEQLAGGAISPRTDLYGLGAVLHEALTGRPPYGSGSPLALAKEQRAGPPALDGIDPALAGVVAACLAYEPTARPIHAGAVAGALRAWLAGEREPAAALAPVDAGPRADPAAATETMPMVAVAAAERTSPSTPVRAASQPAPAGSASGRPPRRGRGPLVPVALGALAVLALLIGASWIGTQGGQAGADPSLLPSATAAPSSRATAPPGPTPVPEPPWLAELVRKVAEQCDEATVTAARDAMLELGEEAGKEYADRLKDECKEANEGEGGGNGNGGGGGNGNDDGGGGNGNGNDG